MCNSDALTVEPGAIESGVPTWLLGALLSMLDSTFEWALGSYLISESIHESGALT